MSTQPNLTGVPTWPPRREAWKDWLFTVVDGKINPSELSDAILWEQQPSARHCQWVIADPTTSLDVFGEIARSGNMCCLTCAKESAASAIDAFLQEFESRPAQSIQRHIATELGVSQDDWLAVSHHGTPRDKLVTQGDIDKRNEIIAKLWPVFSNTDCVTRAMKKVYYTTPRTFHLEHYWPLETFQDNYDAMVKFYKDSALAAGLDSPSDFLDVTVKTEDVEPSVKIEHGSAVVKTEEGTGMSLTTNNAPPLFKRESEGPPIKQEPDW